jgi:C1A family cysteine protease
MKLRKRLGDGHQASWLWRTTGILLIFGLLCSGGMAGAVAPNQPPPGPAEFQRAPQRPAVERNLPPGTGFIPPPMDLSHLTGEAILRGKDSRALPPSFDWRDQGKVTPVKNQGNCGSCYAFGYLGSVESKLLIDGDGTFDLSENNAKECNWRELNNFQYPPGTPWGSCDGGNAFMMSSLFSQAGTVLESCDPYQASDVTCTSSCPYQHNLLDWRLVSGNAVPNPEVLKQYLHDHGPLITSMFSDRQEFFDYDGSYTLDYSGPGNDTDHCVLIVGWSNNLPPKQGSTNPATGWIVKNSWGTDWGDQGYFYIAYGAANIGIFSSFPYELQAHDPNGDIWFYDDDGWWEEWGYNTPTAWGLAKFIPDKNTNVTRVEFWTTDVTTDVDVYLYDDFDGSAASNLLAQKLDNAYSEAGYHSVLLDTPVPVTSGDDVIAVVKFTNDSYGFPLAADPQGSIETGRTYFGPNGSNWTDIGDGYNTDLAIRLRTSTGGPPAPVVTSITPSSGTDDGVVSITNLAGNHFRSGASVKLTMAGQADILATGVTVVSASKITCQFDLTGRALGLWDVVVTNPDSQSGSLADGFRIRAAGQKEFAYLPLIMSQQLPVGSDATVLQGYPTLNLGATVDMWAGYDQCDARGQTARSLVRFNLSTAGAGPPVTKAILWLYLVNSCDFENRPHQVTAHRATSSWSEGAAAWFNQPASAEAYGSAVIPSRQWGWYTLDVTGLVQAWTNSTYPNHGLVLRSNESAGDDSARLGFATKEWPELDKRPYLQIVRMGQTTSEFVPVRQPKALAPVSCGPTLQDSLDSFSSTVGGAEAGFVEQSLCRPD